MSKKRVIVAGEIFSSNLGDYAIFDSLSSILISKDIEVIPLDISFRKEFIPKNNVENSEVSLNKGSWKNLLPKKIKHTQFIQYFITRLMWYLSIKPRSHQYWEELIISSDGVIIGGGQLITDNNSFFSQKIYQIVKLAQKHDKPFTILGCGVGENIGIQAKKTYKKIFNKAVYISLRDIESANKVRSFVDKEISINVNPDLAFALNIEKTKEKLCTKKIICGFNIMPLSFFKSFDASLKDMDEAKYLGFWKKLAEGAINAGMQVVIMTNGNLQDYQQAKVVYQMLRENGIEATLFDRAQRPSTLYEQIRKVDCLVAMRMHSGIIAKAFGKQVAVLVWDQKIPDVWNVFGSQEIISDSSIFKNDQAWLEIEKKFHASRNLSKCDSEVKIKVIESVDQCLKYMI
ncbi:polysaccharide pyruvyl transferase family protein [Acinetobacter sp. ANC 5033]|uniref:polysaccharide pyruvyl transferase family protein n=1 Tax=Acinetobacter amyesii TaxID=2942470 RepID=UPI00201B72D2|nr:polysaccharide pyruvyl transferase family protein [Acinetobacter amyesii]MCL6239219.1 polysaccharide pyruvyl transferase family protein [Acinetobacter amyesii]